MRALNFSLPQILLMCTYLHVIPQKNGNYIRSGRSEAPFGGRSWQAPMAANGHCMTTTVRIKRNGGEKGLAFKSGATASSFPEIVVWLVCWPRETIGEWIPFDHVRVPCY